MYRWNALRQKCSENESKFPKRKENKREKNAAEILFSWYLTYLHPVTSGKNMEERLADQFERLNKTPLEYLKGVEDFLQRLLRGVRNARPTRPLALLFRR
ncbi:hypothetical protein HpSIM16_04350 [Helicobacter pylori]